MTLSMNWGVFVGTIMILHLQLHYLEDRRINLVLRLPKKREKSQVGNTQIDFLFQGCYYKSRKHLMETAYLTTLRK